jgi:hypothetical protein
MAEADGWDLAVSLELHKKKGIKSRRKRVRTQDLLLKSKGTHQLGYQVTMKYMDMLGFEEIFQDICF